MNEPEVSPRVSSTPAVPGVEGAEAVIAVFGEWPLFHDAEICALATESDAAGTTVIATLHAFAVTADVDERGCYRLDRHTRITLHFQDCTDVRIKGLGPPQALFALHVRQANGPRTVRPVEVHFESNAGSDGHLMCRQILVADVRPWQPAADASGH